MARPKSCLARLFGIGVSGRVRSTFRNHRINVVAFLAVIAFASPPAEAIPAAQSVTLETTCALSGYWYYWEYYWLWESQFSCTGVTRGGVSGFSDQGDLAAQSPFSALCETLCSTTVSGRHSIICIAGKGPLVTMEAVATIQGLSSTWLDASAPKEPAELVIPFSVAWAGPISYIGALSNTYYENMGVRFLSSGRTARGTLAIGEGALLSLDDDDDEYCVDHYFSDPAEYSMTLAFVGL